MGSSKFFTNEPVGDHQERRLLKVFEAISQEMRPDWTFRAVTGYLRLSSYLAVKEKLKDARKIQILVGIDAGDYPKILSPDGGPTSNALREQRFKVLAAEAMQEDIARGDDLEGLAKSCAEFEEDFDDGRIEVRIHKDRALHAKFYIFLPQEFNVDSYCRVIMGSSNLTPPGLGEGRGKRYELNVTLGDYEDVVFCNELFETLWQEAVPLTREDVRAIVGKTYRVSGPTPYELYLRVLMEAFGRQVEDAFELKRPEGVLDLRYQRDAVIQGYQMLLRYHGLFLADVVGLGKTVVAAMIAHRFVEKNGQSTKVLVVHPPALKENWVDTFASFDLSRYAQFVSNGQLSKVLERTDGYLGKGAYDLIIVDEAHGFRNAQTDKFDYLQRLTKAARTQPGLLTDSRTYVMLLSATPLNNSPEDLQSQLLLFQDGGNCTIEGVPNLQHYFAPLLKEYEMLRGKQKDLAARASGGQSPEKATERQGVVEQVDKLYKKIREDIIEKVTIRRTRNNITNNEDYNDDLRVQGITFPKVEPPESLDYELPAECSALFYDTLRVLVDKLNYARYRAIEYLRPEFQKEYKNAKVISDNLMWIYKTLLVKRLESSFEAFRRTLGRLKDSTHTLIKMYDEQDKVLIAPKADVNELIGQGKTLEEIYGIGGEKGGKVYPRSAFMPEFINRLREDYSLLEAYCEKWGQVRCDPKLDEFLDALNAKLLSPDNNPTGKLVIFSESEDTVKYLYEQLTHETNRRVLLVTSATRDKLSTTVQENFDANLPEEAQRDEYDILLTTDVLAEGVNLHRANTVVHYDTPWNATRLIQRLGRVNRIGSKAEKIYNYVFYPSPQGDSQIDLYRKSLVKLQSFHSAYGEDNKFFTFQEMVESLTLYDPNVPDVVDQQLKLLQELRKVYQKEPALYRRVQALSVPSRALCPKAEHGGESVVLISSSYRTGYYRVTAEGVQEIDFLAAAKHLETKRETRPLPLRQREKLLCAHEALALAQYKQQREQTETRATCTSNAQLGPQSRTAVDFLVKIRYETEVDKDVCRKLQGYVQDMVYVRLPRELERLSKDYSKKSITLEEVEKALRQLWADYCTEPMSPSTPHGKGDEAQIVVAETFV